MEKGGGDDRYAPKRDKSKCKKGKRNGKKEQQIKTVMFLKILIQHARSHTTHTYIYAREVCQ